MQASQPYGMHGHICAHYTSETVSTQHGSHMACMHGSLCAHYTSKTVSTQGIRAIPVSIGKSMRQRSNVMVWLFFRCSGGCINTTNKVTILMAGTFFCL